MTYYDTDAEFMRHLKRMDERSDENLVPITYKSSKKKRRSKSEL